MTDHSTRSVSAEESFARAWESRHRIGVTRLAEVTGLDVIGIPVWQAIRPAARSLSVSQGKGTTDLHARLGALMEAYEAHAAERLPVGRWATIEELRPLLGYDPATLPRRLGPLPERTRIPWTPAHVLHADAHTWIPSPLLSLDFTNARLVRPTFAAWSTGLAAGGCRVDAVLHALYEVVERSPSHPGPSVSREALHADPGIGPLVERIEAAGLSVAVRYRRARVDLPCVEARLDAEGGVTTFVGTGCNLDVRRAVRAALLEGVQSRLTNITGAREDIHDEDYLGEQLVRPTLAAPPEMEAPVPLPAAISPPPDAETELARVAARLADAGCPVLVADLDVPDTGIAVAAVVVPGLFA